MRMRETMEQPLDIGIERPASASQPSGSAAPLRGIQMPFIRKAIVAILFLFFCGIAVLSGAADPIALMVGVPILLLVTYVFIIMRIDPDTSSQLQIKPDKTAYSPGEEITGSITLNLEKERQARGLKVRFYGLKSSGKYMARVCTAEAVLSGARTYRKGESLRFSIAIPLQAKQYLGQNAGVGRNAVFWNVEARLDLPLEKDMVARENVVL